MMKDECILVDESDNVIGHCSKKAAHDFNATAPRGALHRAFSVFLFDTKGRLLLQQRASEKITFPNVWTNTCCSHPLYPLDVDGSSDATKSIGDGAKNAAIRKLEHELGIDPSKLSRKDFKYLTRLHYWAADVVSHGPNAPWGEHEIDYILFIKKNVQLKPNPEEVRDTKYVTISELRAMMDPSSGLLWSPWFRIIAEKFLVHWWKNLSETLNTDTFVDHQTIYRFDPSPEHMGGRGKAGKWLGQASYEVAKMKDAVSGSSAAVAAVANTAVNAKSSKITADNVKYDSSLKQGAYGKVKIHKHSILDQISHLDEIFAAVWMLYGPQMPSKIDTRNENVQFCDMILGKVSRSFASVIRQLPEGLCIDVLIFYLALRALDTIEDDMQAFKGKEHEKISHLNTFYSTGLITEGWSMDGVGEGDEALLLKKYYICVAVFHMLSPASQAIISDITRRMGEGMAMFASKDLGQGTVTVKDYHLYCHFVAGLVGEGLSRLFSSSGYESVQVANVSKTLANTMGLFLQQTNIIRDYLEDFVDGRTFWPQEIWKIYAPNNNLGDFADPTNSTQAVACLNHMITIALEGIPECLEYMALLKTEEVFQFCAIPQVMAIATLADLYNNPKVFTGVVKIRKGLACQLIADTKTVGKICRTCLFAVVRLLINYALLFRWLT